MPGEPQRQKWKNLAAGPIHQRQSYVRQNRRSRNGRDQYDNDSLSWVITVVEAAGEGDIVRAGIAAFGCTTRRATCCFCCCLLLLWSALIFHLGNKVNARSPLQVSGVGTAQQSPQQQQQQPLILPVPPEVARPQPLATATTPAASTQRPSPACSSSTAPAPPPPLSSRKPLPPSPPPYVFPVIWENIEDHQLGTGHVVPEAERGTGLSADCIAHERMCE